MSIDKMLHHLGRLVLEGLNIEVGGTGGVVEASTMLRRSGLRHHERQVVQHFVDQPLGESHLSIIFTNA